MFGSPFRLNSHQVILQKFQIAFPVSLNESCIFKLALLSRIEGLNFAYLLLVNMDRKFMCVIPD